MVFGKTNHCVGGMLFLLRKRESDLSQWWGKENSINFLLSPTLSKLRCLTLFDNYSWPMMESISAARKDSLEMLFVRNIHSSYKIPNLPNLKILETHGGITSLDNLPNLQKLQFLKIMDFARDCTVPSNSLPNLVQLNVGSCTRYFGPPGQVCYPNKVTYFYYNVKVWKMSTILILPF